MASPTTVQGSLASRRTAFAYAPPELLEPLHILDLLELSGSQPKAALALSMHRCRLGGPLDGTQPRGTPALLSLGFGGRYGSRLPARTRRPGCLDTADGLTLKPSESRPYPFFSRMSATWRLISGKR